VTSIVFAGIGGQGVITVSNIVGRAAVIEGKNAMMTELHGMAQRGGRISVDLRIGNYRNAIIPNGSADVIVAFEEMEAVRNIGKMKEDGIIIINERRIHPITLIRNAQNYPEREMEEILSRFNVIRIRADEIALKLGSKKSVNMVMLGALYASGTLELKEESIMRAVEESFGSRYMEINKNAFLQGRNAMGREVVR